MSQKKNRAGAVVDHESGRVPERLRPGRHRSSLAASSHHHEIDLPFGCDRDEQPAGLPGINVDRHGPRKPVGSVLALCEDPFGPRALGRTDPFQPVSRQRSAWETPTNQLHLAAGPGVVDMNQQELPLLEGNKRRQIIEHGLRVVPVDAEQNEHLVPYRKVTARATAATSSMPGVTSAPSRK